MRRAFHGYYAILDVPPGRASDLEAARSRALRLITADPCWLQVRAKGASAAELLALGRAVLPLARAAGIPLCINDRLDVALVLGADAVHLGQDDLPLAEARQIAGGRLCIGISTHDRAQVKAALAGGADYLGFGPIYPTQSKQNPDPVVGLAALRQACHDACHDAIVPVVAIGGIGLPEVRAVAEAGAAAVAVISAMERAPDAALAGRAIQAIYAAINRGRDRST
jgi:thiamine-phosphate pyrophosphorylase